MKRVRIISLTLAVCCLLGLGIHARAVEVDCDQVYCFSGQEFAEETLSGICITKLPDPSTGTVFLGARVLRPGDILTAEQLAQMTFQPLRTEEDTQAVISYLPIFSNRVEKNTTMTIGIRGKEDKAPVAEDCSLETYKNLPLDGALKVSDPEGEKLTYTLVRNPKRGTVEVQPDGKFTYTPKKNKVGIDSFTYTATDPAGNVSRVATVTIQILKPTDARQYADTIGQSCRFAAEWMKNTGLFVGEQIGESTCFNPGKTVSREEFLAMVVQVLNIPTQDSESIQLPVTAPQWLKPYLAAAQRSGLTADWETSALDQPITGAEVAVILQNALDLTVSSEVLQTVAQQEEISTREAACLAVMAEYGMVLDASAPMTRGEVAETLYQISKLAPDAPGMAVFRKQQ